MPVRELTPLVNHDFVRNDVTTLITTSHCFRIPCSILQSLLTVRQGRNTCAHDKHLFLLTLNCFSEQNVSGTKVFCDNNFFTHTHITHAHQNPVCYSHSQPYKITKGPAGDPVLRFFLHRIFLSLELLSQSTVPTFPITSNFDRQKLDSWHCKTKANAGVTHNNECDSHSVLLSRSNRQDVRHFTNSCFSRGGGQVKTILR